MTKNSSKDDTLWKVMLPIRSDAATAYKVTRSPARFKNTPSQILCRFSNNRLECDRPEPHRGRREGRHPHTGPHVHNQTRIPLLTFEEPLQCRRYVGTDKGLSLEYEGYALVGLVIRSRKDSTGRST